MRSDITYGKHKIFLNVYFNDKIERYLDNLFDYYPSFATVINANLFKELISLTPSRLISTGIRRGMNFLGNYINVDPVANIQKRINISIVPKQKLRELYTCWPGIKYTKTDQKMKNPWADALGLITIGN